MPNITADKVVNHLMYAKANVNAYEPGGKIVVKTFSPGQLIGNVYSYIEIGNDLYWMFYLTPADYNNFNAVYVKHDASKLSLPDLPAILDQIAAEKKAAIIAKKVSEAAAPAPETIPAQRPLFKVFWIQINPIGPRGNEAEKPKIIPFIKIIIPIYTLLFLYYFGL